MLRDGTRQEIQARVLVPGDVLLVEEGESVCADARLMTGTLEVDMCNNADLDGPGGKPAGDPTELALLELAAACKGAPEEVLARVTRIYRGDRDVAITADDRDEAARVMVGYAQRGLRVLAVARRVLPAGSPVPAQRQDAERDMCLTGMAAMLDPLRPQVPAAIARLHRAGIRVNGKRRTKRFPAAASATAQERSRRAQTGVPFR